ncbi:SpaH/EbpB family LPXTG-anchored major pilin [Citricoccus zhacaiensis]
MKALSCRRALLKATTIAAGATLALGGLALPAHAAPVVDSGAEGSLTIHKYDKLDTASGVANNGTQVSVPEGYTALENVRFAAQKVEDIDLGTNAGWRDASELAVAFDAANVRYADGAAAAVADAGHSLSAAVTETTNADGEAFFTGLEVGQYLITETGYPSGVTPSAPFLVTVPLTDPDNNNQWIYDVHVYPKNAVTTAEKTVSDADDIKLGDQIDYTITGQIPNEEIIDGYKVVDTLDAKLGYVGTRVSLSNGTAVTEGTHFTVAHNESSNAVTVEFTAAGRAVLAANHTADVLVQISTTVNAVGEIANEAHVYPNRPSFGIEPGQPGGPTTTPEIETKWGEITFQKTDEQDRALTGAQFSVFASEADARSGANPISLGGKTVFGINDEGQLTLSGLRYSDFANGETVAEGQDGYQTYWLVETAAPAGYELLAAPVEFTITAGTTAPGVDQDIVNVPSNAGFELPLTGGTGTTLLYAAGVLLVGGAVLMAVRSRRNA